MNALCRKITQSCFQSRVTCPIMILQLFFAITNHNDDTSFSSIME
jgi:hypothetical protein